MAINIFTKAKAYQKKHPRTAWQDCIQAVKKSAKAPVKKAVKKTISGTPKKKAAAPKKTIKVSKKGSVKMTIGSVSLSKINQEQNHCSKLENEIGKIKTKMKEKGLLASEKTELTRLMNKAKEAYKISRSHIQQLKKLL